jgi:hypothetical protein
MICFLFMECSLDDQSAIFVDTMNGNDRERVNYRLHLGFS